LDIKVEMFKECKQFRYFNLFDLIFRKRICYDKEKKCQKPHKIRGFGV